MLGRCHTFIDDEDEKTGWNEGQGEYHADRREYFQCRTRLQFAIELDIGLWQWMIDRCDAVVGDR